MSWDVLLIHLPDDFTSLPDLPQGFTPPVLGSRDDVLAALRDAVPDADFSDPAWGELEGRTWSMEFSIGANEPMYTIMLHIRGAGDDVLVPVVRSAEALHCKALDISTGSVLGRQDVAGWHEFQTYRDRVLGAAE